MTPIRDARPDFSIRDTIFVIPRIDYERTIHFVPSNPYPQTDMTRIPCDEIFLKQEHANVIENETPD